MIRYTILSIALLFAAAAAAQDPLQPLDESSADVPPPAVIDPDIDPRAFDLARRKAVDCEGEKFVFAWGAGANPTKVTLCSKKDATRDELVQMLDDAATKLEGSDIADDRRVAIVQQIRAKISELQGAPAAVPVAPVLATDSAPESPPQTIVAPVTSPPARAVPARTTLPTKPRLSFECDSPTEPGSGGPCDFLKRDTRITVTAGEALPDGVGLRFLRRGQTRAEVSLGSMRMGQSTRIVLPPSLCSGVSRTESRIEVVRSGQVVDSIGPFSLRC